MKAPRNEPVSRNSKKMPLSQNPNKTLFKAEKTTSEKMMNDEKSNDSRESIQNRPFSGSH